MGWTAPERHLLCQDEAVETHHRREPSVDRIIRIGMDTSKRIFQLHGVNEAEQPVLRRKLSRVAMVAFFERLEPSIVAMEACAASHHWARELARMSHEVRLIAPQLVKPYVKRGKNDAADAEALCEAASRPTMRFVPVKTRDQQPALMLAGARERLVRQLTQLVNAIRGHAAEFGITVAKGRAHIPELLALVKSDETLPALARGVFEGLEAVKSEDRAGLIDAAPCVL